MGSFNSLTDGLLDDGFILGNFNKLIMSVVVVKLDFDVWKSSSYSDSDCKRLNWSEINGFNHTWSFTD